MTEATRVFVSYSRSDFQIIKSIVDFLTIAGFFVDYDASENSGLAVERGIAPGDDWWSRLKENITECDVFLFCVSESSIASKVCDDEIYFAQTLKKKIIPLQISDIDFAQVPDRLAALNIVLDLRDSTNEEQKLLLKKAIEIDIHWLRNLRKITVLSQRWQASGKLTDNLLLGEVLKDFEKWRRSSPSQTNSVPSLVDNFLDSSREHNNTLLKEKQQRRKIARRAPINSLVFVSLLMVVLQTALFVVTLANSFTVALERRVEAARMAVLALEAAPSRLVTEELSDELMDAAGVLGVAERIAGFDGGIREQLFPVRAPIQSDVDVISLSETGQIDQLGRAIWLLLNDEDRIFIVNAPGNAFGRTLEVAMNSDQFRSEVVYIFYSALQMNVFISLFVGVAVYLYVRSRVSNRINKITT